MKLALLIALGCIACVCSAPQEEPDLKKVEFSEKAIYQLKKASLRAISDLCFGDEVDQDIYDVICKKAIANLNSPKSAAVTRQSANCINCEVADPICWDDCPQ